MLASIIDQAIGIFRDTFLRGDAISLVIAFGSVLVASLLMRRGSQIGSMTLFALVLFALGGFLRGYVRTGPVDGTTGGGRAAAQLEASWNSFLAMSAGELLAYFVSFMVFILILYGVRAVFGRG